MILRIYDKSGKEVAMADVAGSVWRLAHVGFVNDSAIYIRYHTDGKSPFRSIFFDYFGIERGKGIVDFPSKTVYKGDTGVFNSGNFIIDMTPLQKEKEDGNRSS